MHLLDVLANEMGLEYLSDLRFKKTSSRLSAALEKINEDDYPLDEWCSTVRYITETENAFSSPSEAKSFLAESVSERENGGELSE